MNSGNIKENTGIFFTFVKTGRWVKPDLFIGRTKTSGTIPNLRKA